MGRAYGDEKYEAKIQNNNSQNMSSSCTAQKIDGIVKRERRRFSKSLYNILLVLRLKINNYYLLKNEFNLDFFKIIHKLCYLEYRLFNI